jgi:hypothetical protein
MIFNLFQLDPLAADLDLGIFSTDELQPPYRVVPNQITCFIKSPATALSSGGGRATQPARIVDKACCGLDFIIQIPSAHQGPFDEEFTHSTNGGELVVVRWTNDPRIGP